MTKPLLTIAGILLICALLGWMFLPTPQEQAERKEIVASTIYFTTTRWDWKMIAEGERKPICIEVTSPVQEFLPPHRILHLHEKGCAIPIPPSTTPSPTS